MSAPATCDFSDAAGAFSSCRAATFRSPASAAN
jgi:hypothetical protein